MAEEKHKEPFIPRSSGERVAHARRLLGVREGRDILPSDLAEMVGVTVNAVYAWEAGTVPGPTNFKRLAEALGVPVEWLHYGVERMLDDTQRPVGSVEPRREDVDAERAKQQAKRNAARKVAGGDQPRPTHRPKPR